MTTPTEEPRVQLRKLIGEIGANFDRRSKLTSKAHRLLRRSETELKQWIPAGHLVEGFGGKATPTITPRIAVFDPDETSTTRHGMFVAYLFAADNSSVTLTLNQGVAQTADQLGRAGARLVLALEATTIRKAMRPDDVADLDFSFDLRTKAALAADYKHANIVSRTYRLDALPPEQEMIADLKRFVNLQALAVKARESAPGKQAPAQPEPEIVVARKNKLLTGAVTRRGLLAAIVAAPILSVTPTMAASWNRDKGKQQGREAMMPTAFVPAQPAPVFTVDVSQHDWRRMGGNLDWAGIRDGGIVGMCARATYGDPAGYHWPTHHFGAFARASRMATMGLRGGYHNLVRGDQESINRQVDWLRRELDAHDANWAMLDIERYAELVKAEMWPRWEDVRRFDDRWAQVESRVLVGYLPPWNWSKHLGQPDLREFRGPLIASNYPSSANEDYRRLYERIGADNGRGWAEYGNRTPEGWQYSSRAKVPGAPNICDVNAWRMSSGELRSLLLERPKA